MDSFAGTAAQLRCAEYLGQDNGEMREELSASCRYANACKRNTGLKKPTWRDSWAKITKSK